MYLAGFATPFALLGAAWWAIFKIHDRYCTHTQCVRKRATR